MVAPFFTSNKPLFYDVNNTPMQVNNRKLARHFVAGKPYSTKDRGVEIAEDFNGIMCVYAKLYKTYIAKRDLNGNLYISNGGWHTPTTTKAINACLPVGWRYSRRQLISPNKKVIDIPSTGWILVEEPVLKYMLTN
jgi:hypothetical protein